MMLNQEQIEAHFQAFIKHWKEHYEPQMLEKQIPLFDQGRMFQELWMEWKLEAETSFLENSGQLDLP